MNIKKNITLELSENDVKEIIADYLTREGHAVTAEDIKFLVCSRTEGYGTAEHRVYYFNAAKVKL